MSTPRQRLPEEERQLQIVRAAARVSARLGLANLTVRAVATEAGISHGLVIHHFGSKEGLQKSLFDWLVAELLGPPASPDPALSTEQQLLWTIQQHLAALRDKTSLVGLLLEFRMLARIKPCLREEVRRELDSVHHAYLPLTTGLVESHPDRFTGTDAVSLAKTIGYLLIGYEINRFSNPQGTDESDITATLQALLRTDVPSLA